MTESATATTAATESGLVIVQSAVAPILGSPRISTAPTSQALAGETLTVLAADGDWLQVRATDGYEGWTHAGYVRPFVAGDNHALLFLGGEVEDAHGKRIALPLGARIPLDWRVVSGELLTSAQQRERFPRTPSAIANSAATLFSGASYQWAGVSPWGCDCSGLVQRIFALHGVSLPRDAWQQALEGQRVADAANAQHQSADLLFFSDREDRRITHVGIALDHTRMVHSALRRGGVSIENLGADDAYVARLREQCTGVQRVL